MKVSKQRLIHMIHEELHAVLLEKGVKLEHRGEPCERKQGAARRECEEQAEDAIKINREETQKKRMYSANDEELEALQRAKVYNMNPKLRTRSDEIKPGDVINPNLNEKKRAKKKHCTDGNKWHDKNGRFSTKSNATSWSGSNPDNKDNCTYGWSRSKGNGERLITKLMCGREGGKEGKPDPDRKAPYKCKDGKKYYEKSLKEVLLTSEDDMIDAGDWYIIRKDLFDELLMQNTDNVINQINQHVQRTLQESKISDAEHQRCIQLGYRSFEHFIKSINAIQLASQGKLLEPPKEK